MSDYVKQMIELREKEKRLKKVPLFQEIIKFQELQKECKDFGAYDTEPSYTFKEFIIGFFSGREVKVPVTAGQWELFSDMPGVEGVAKKLTKQLERIMNTRVTMKEVADVLSWFGWNRYFR